MTHDSCSSDGVRPLPPPTPSALAPLPLLHSFHRSTTAAAAAPARALCCTAGLKLSVPEACSYIRNELATALRKAPYQVNMLVGGMDDDGPHLVFMDYLASAAPVNYGAQGYAGYFVSSLMDRHWKAGMSLEDGVALARICAKEIRTRLVVSTPRFIVKIVDATGIRELPFEPAPAVPGMPEAGAADAGAVGEGGVAPAVAGAGAGAGAGAAVAAGGRGMDE